jgi:hypothetical protein
VLQTFAASRQDCNLLLQPEERQVEKGSQEEILLLKGYWVMMGWQSWY